MTSAAITEPSIIPGGAARILTRIVHGIGLLATIAAATALLIELAVVLVSIAGRTLVGHGPLWSDEASRLALTIIAFVGGAAAYRGAHHTAIRLITDRLGRHHPPGRRRRDRVAGADRHRHHRLAVHRPADGQLEHRDAHPADQHRLDHAAGDGRPAADRAVRAGAAGGRLFLAHRRD